MDSNWVGIGISVLVMLGGTAVNLFIIGRFVGQWGESMRNIAETLKKVEDRVEEVGEHGEQIPLLDQRLTAAEVAVAKLSGMSDQIVRLTTTIEIDGKHSREKLDSVGRSIAVIERQLANIATGRTSGLTVISSEDPR